MNTIVANYLKGIIEPLAFTERVAGMTRTVSMTQPAAAGVGLVVKKFPVSCEVSHRDCISNKQHHLVPDSNLRSLIYFEDDGASPNGKTARGLSFQGNIRLVCWMNLNKLGQTSCSASALAIGQLVKLLNAVVNVNGQSPLNSIRIEGISIVRKDASIFSRYSYNETQAQYLLYPYDYFALDLTVTYEIPFDCINDDWVTTAITCTDNSAS